MVPQTRSGMSSLFILNRLLNNISSPGVVLVMAFDDDTVDEENLKNVEKSGTDELDWSLNLNNFELNLFREIISIGDIATVLQLQHHQSKSQENSTNFPATGTTATPPVDVAMNIEFTARQCNEMVVSG
ncbi:unnamed protein product [Lactuca saligna]|uniref:Uncharacterized protein n=1 Tax=Lactuca saligna TaxID=75948 RepID=A0AA35Y038_LACSI|nr:unnamed protein product [Lactuca saligna]